MEKKSLYGIFGILFATIVVLVATSLYGSAIKLNYIEQIHLQDGYLYYVDRGTGDDFKIIRSDPDGKHGNLIQCNKHDREQYRMIRQIFFDDKNQAYVLIQETNVEFWNGISCKVYQCDFASGKLLETGYDLTKEVGSYSQISVQSIRDGKLYYIGISDLENSAKNAKLMVQGQDGKKETKDEIPLKYPYLNAQFFLSKNDMVLWTDYAGEVYAKELGTDQ